MSFGRRLHLLELEDQPWFPAVLRDAMTDYLSFIGNSTSFSYRPLIPKLTAALRRLGQDRLVDLCTGGGGPAMTVARLLSKSGQPVRLTLTDLYPNRARLELSAAHAQNPVELVFEPVDATSVPESLTGLRTMFNAFHHMTPQMARRVLADAVAQRQGIAIVEFLQRSPLSLLSIFAIGGVQLLVTPFLRPFRMSRLLFTYALPLIPLCTLWDGLVSCLRMYSPAELEELVASLGATDYLWDIGQLSIPLVPARITYLIGTPQEAKP